MRMISQAIFSFLIFLTVTLQPVSARDKIVVGFTNTPQYIVQDKYTSLGIEHEILTKFATTNNLQIEFVKFDLKQEVLDALENKQIDIAAGHLTGSLFAANPIFATEPYDDESLVLISHKQFHNRNLPLPTTQTVFQPRNYDFSNLNTGYLLGKSKYNEMELIKAISSGIENYALMTENVARALVQIFPFVDIRPVKSETNKVNNVFYVADQALKIVLNNFITNYKTTDEFKYLTYTYYSPLKRFFRTESTLFVQNMQTKFLNYNELFKKYSTDVDYRFPMAIGYQESRWTANAVSPWGPSGLMMLTNASARALGVTNKLDASQSIREGTKLYIKFRNGISGNLKTLDRNMFGAASYNQGPAKVIDARLWLRNNGKDDASWVSLIDNYPAISQSNHKYGKINGKAGAEYLNGVLHWYFMLINYQHFYNLDL